MIPNSYLNTRATPLIWEMKASSSPAVYYCRFIKIIGVTFFFVPMILEYIFNNLKLCNSSSFKQTLKVNFGPEDVYESNN